MLGRAVHRVSVDSRILNHDPLTGVTEVFHFDDVTGDITLELQQTSGIDALNAAEYNDAPDYGPSRWKGEWHKVASIPLVELYRLQREGKIGADGTVEDNESLAKLLNDRDYLKFRCKPGKL